MSPIEQADLLRERRHAGSVMRRGAILLATVPLVVAVTVGLSIVERGIPGLLIAGWGGLCALFGTTVGLLDIVEGARRRRRASLALRRVLPSRTLPQARVIVR